MKSLQGLLFTSVMLVVSTVGKAQSSETLEGRVYSDNNDVSGTHVLNTTTNRATITDANGFFDIVVRLNDTLVFSAVQYKRKEIVVSESVLESKLLLIPLEEALNELDEVVVTPYNLSGHMASDLKNLEIDPVVTASTLGLPNAHAKRWTQSERLLREASAMSVTGTTSGLGAGGAVSLNPIINGITGRTKMLKKRVKRDRAYSRTERVRAFYVDSLYTTELKIPQDKIDDFLYFCEVDADFQKVVDGHDRLKIWTFMKRKSVVYRKNYEAYEEGED
ncbi:CarboxypepD_reg-like domain-containing protein [Zobellia uliginosa]|uniref:CarboxypepD_reg-like domain-containing protein n=1 Tax=Zobellia uliginosa TaxID=143224 RepID=A0ABY1KYU0_9FLAO|nr:carboxypeptidase-like regulatory domain-containing protein [Zobellia uliginosa]SIS94981.1 CarboxypepD_reg-like domain-containing protein [Zobellia uliginosa]